MKLDIHIVIVVCVAIIAVVSLFTGNPNLSATCVGGLIGYLLPRKEE